MMPWRCLIGPTEQFMIGLDFIRFEWPGHAAEQRRCGHTFCISTNYSCIYLFIYHTRDISYVFSVVNICYSFANVLQNSFAKIYFLNVNIVFGCIAVTK